MKIRKWKVSGRASVLELMDNRNSLEEELESAERLEGGREWS